MCVCVCVCVCVCICLFIIYKLKEINKHIHFFYISWYDGQTPMGKRPQLNGIIDIFNSVATLSVELRHIKV